MDSISRTLTIIPEISTKVNKGWLVCEEEGEEEKEEEVTFSRD